MPQKKKTKKKITNRKKRPKKKPLAIAICDIDEFYKVLNKVQTSKEQVVFAIKEEDSPMVENILRDAELSSKKKITTEGILQYTVFPGEEKIKTYCFDDLEQFSDEIIEDGQIF